MLRELTGYRSFGTLSQLCGIIGYVGASGCSLNDIKILMQTRSNVEPARADASIALLSELGICMAIDGRVSSIDSSWAALVPNGRVAYRFSSLLLARMFKEGVIPRDGIEFDPSIGKYCIPSYRIQLRFAPMRNLLIESGLLSDSNHVFYFADNAKVTRSCIDLDLSGMTPNQLVLKMEKDKEIGEAAEKAVLKYERARVGGLNADKIQQVSLVSVSAGFDIASFDSAESDGYDRLIEVKAVGDSGFHFSYNEMQQATKYGKSYCLYLVVAAHMHDNSYVPIIIRDPITFLKSNNEWRSVPDSLHFTKI
jgi:hypothetical protein